MEKTWTHSLIANKHMSAKHEARKFHIISDCILRNFKTFSLSFTLIYLYFTDVGPLGFSSNKTSWAMFSSYAEDCKHIICKCWKQ